MNRYKIEFVGPDGQVLYSRSGLLRDLDAIERRIGARDDVAVFIRQVGADRRIAHEDGRGR